MIATRLLPVPSDFTKIISAVTVITVSLQNQESGHKVGLTLECGWLSNV